MDDLVAGIPLVQEEVEGGLAAGERRGEPVLLLYQSIKKVCTGVIVVFRVRSILESVSDQTWQTGDR